MPVGKGKTSISTVLSDNLKERLQRIADNRKWTLSQTVRECLESFIDNWEEQLGIEPSTKKKPK